MKGEISNQLLLLKSKQQEEIWSFTKYSRSYKDVSIDQDFLMTRKQSRKINEILEIFERECPTNFGEKRNKILKRSQF